MKIIQEKIAIQKKRLAKIQDGYAISETASISDEYNYTYWIENGLAMTEFAIKNNKAMKMLEFITKFRFFDSLKNDQSLRDITIHRNKKEEKEKKQREKEKAEQIEKQNKDIILNKEIQERIDEKSDEEEDENDDSFIKLEPLNGDAVQIDRSKLVECDMFCKKKILKMKYTNMT